MSWTTASIELNDNQIQIRSFWCQWTFSPRRSQLHILITVEYRDNLDWYSVLSLFFQSLLHEESFTLYILLWTIFTLHLLIIRALTWVPVPLDTLSGFLWVVIAKVVLFRGFLHINAARKVVVMHLMRCQQLSLRYFEFPSFSLVHKARTHH